MPKVIDAIYENGVFKPLGKVDIKDNEKVRIIVAEEGKSREEECTLDGIIDIAKDCSDTDLSIHHDKYLYGEAHD